MVGFITIACQYKENKLTRQEGLADSCYQIKFKSDITGRGNNGNGLLPLLSYITFHIPLLISEMQYEMYFMKR
jgi:hypothetical protein